MGTGADHTYTAKEIADLRSVIAVLYVHPLGSLGVYEQTSLVEQMLQTYMAAGVTYLDLMEIYRARVVEEQRKKEAGTSD